MDLKDIRNRIDSVDTEIVGLLSKRMELAVRAIKLKTKTLQSDREAEVLARVKSASRALIAPDFSEKLFTEIMAESRRLQDKELRLIGFQGEHGAYSEMAIKSLEPEAVTIPHTEFGDVFEGVASGVLDFGMVPVENSLAGNVGPVDDLLADTELKIVGELVMPIHHCLMTLPGADYRDIRVVYSHPQALAQCKGFLSRNKLEARPYYDTAGAAMMLARERPAAAAVIASHLSAELYGLEVLKENIEDNHTNATRFLKISRNACEQAGNKCTIAFSTAHKPGALLCILSAFSEAEINLTRIESRPMPRNPGMYVFLLDFLGSDRDEKVTSALEKVKKDAPMFRLLGCYQKASV